MELVLNPVCEGNGARTGLILSAIMGKGPGSLDLYLDRTHKKKKVVGNADARSFVIQTIHPNSTMGRYRVFRKAPFSVFTFLKSS